MLAVLTAADVTADGLNDLPPTVEANVHTGERFHFTPMPLLARDEVRYVGQLVALVVAETKAQALDAAELVRGRLRHPPCGDRTGRRRGEPELLMHGLAIGRCRRRVRLRRACGFATIA